MDASSTRKETEEVRIQIIEGWSIADLQRLLQETHGIPEDASIRVMGKAGGGAAFDASFRLSFPFLAHLPRGRSLEGYLFPDTYRVWRGQLPIGLVKKELEAFAERIASQALTRESAPLKTLDEVVILASIVEKEVSTPEARNMVAGIFLRRLREGIPLQSDATVNYITHSGRARASAEDLTIKSLYNTYRQRGLPPGPISNPGEVAIQAVLHPTPSPYRYFLTDERGQMYYARTLAEHILNRRKAGF